MRQESFVFAERIRKERDEGYGFVPLVGSGLSAGSGIPTTKEFDEYLFKCLYKVLTSESGVKNRWNPRRWKWPDLYRWDVDKDRFEWIREIMSRVVKAREKFDGIDQLKLQWEAVGTLADWRSALQFLSRLDEQELQDGAEIVLGVPDHGVIDSFFFHIIGGRIPNVGHVMLAHLADAIRIQTILTTNFDNLIEQAFAKLGMPLATFDVHLKARLPSPDLVLAQRSIVKLHGGRYGLRADHTLDEEPSFGDREAFIRYFVDIVDRKEKLRIEDTKKHLLVLGASGNDRRTLNLIRYALERISNLRIYWVCYSEREEEMIQATIRPRKFEKGRVITTVHSDLGLLLFEIHQHLNLSLPPRDGSFPAFWPVAPGHCENKRKGKEKYFRNEGKRLLRAIEQTASMVGEDAEQGNLVVYGEAGVTSLAASIVGELDEKCECLWLDMDAFCGLYDFLVTLADDVARRLGVPSLMLPASTEDTTVCMQVLKEFLDRSRRNFVIFLNARGGFGTVSSWNVSAQEEWEEEERKAFEKFLANAHLSRATFVLLSNQSSSVAQDIAGKDNGGLALFHLEERCVSKAEETARAVLKKLRAEGGKSAGADSQIYLEAGLRFIYALTLFRYSRHPAMLGSWGLMKAPEPLRTDKEDNDQIRAEAREYWLKLLRDEGAIRHNRGGFVWMHREVCDSIRGTLEREFPTLRNLRSECHQGIADWYVKLFRSSDDPRAVLESLYHRFSCIRWSDEGMEGQNALYVKRTCLIEAAVALKLGQDRILSCGYFNTASNIVGRIEQGIEALQKDGRLNGLDLEVEALKETCGDLEEEFHRGIADFASVLKKNRELIQKSGKRQRTGDSKDKSHKCDAELILEQGIYLTGLRSYQQAEIMFHRLFGELGIVDKVKEWPYFDLGVDEMRDLARRCVVERALVNREDMRLVIKGLRRYMFLEMLIAQILRLNDRIDEAQKRDRYSEAVYTLAMELMRNLNDVYFLQRENCYIRTHYGVLLGNMGRYYEAHRRLNEVSGYLSQSGRGTSRIPWGVIDLRRAEVFLTEAQGILGKGVSAKEKVADDYRKALALVDDAHRALDRAEKYFAGQRRNVWWWTWLYEMQMTVCVCLSKIRKDYQNICFRSRRGDRYQNPALACRMCYGGGQRCIRLLQKGTVLITRDVVRQARLVALFYDFLRNSKVLDAGVSRGELAKAVKHLEHVQKERTKLEEEFGELCKLSDGVGEYIDRILNQVKKFPIPVLEIDQRSNLERERLSPRGTDSASHLPAGE